MIGLQVFKDFWINCQFNSYFSLITSINKSYIDAAYMNHYEYTIESIATGNGTNIKYLRSIPSIYQHKLMQSIIKVSPIIVNNEIDIIDNAIELLKDNFIYVGVDLYYWIPNGICWQKYHKWDHYSLIKCYDNSKECFLVLDDNLNGFDIFEIPKSRFETAVANSFLHPTFLLVDYQKDIFDYSICFDDVIANAKRLTKELSELHVELWNYSDADIERGWYMDLFSTYFFSISNRHIANMLLFERLNNLKYINSASLAHFKAQFLKLINGWDIIKNKFLKGNMTVPKKLDCSAINDLKNILVETEIKVWNLLI